MITIFREKNQNMPDGLKVLDIRVFEIFENALSISEESGVTRKNLIFELSFNCFCAGRVSGKLLELVFWKIVHEYKWLSIF